MSNPTQQGHRLGLSTVPREFALPFQFLHAPFAAHNHRVRDLQAYDEAKARHKRHAHRSSSKQPSHPRCLNPAHPSTPHPIITAPQTAQPRTVNDILMDMSAHLEELHIENSCLRKDIRRLKKGEPLPACSPALRLPEPAHDPQTKNEDLAAELEGVTNSPQDVLVANHALMNKIENDTGRNVVISHCRVGRSEKDEGLQCRHNHSHHTTTHSHFTQPQSSASSDVGSAAAAYLDALRPTVTGPGGLPMTTTHFTWHPKTSTISIIIPPNPNLTSGHFHHTKETLHFKPGTKLSNIPRLLQEHVRHGLNMTPGAIRVQQILELRAEMGLRLLEDDVSIEVGVPGFAGFDAMGEDMGVRLAEDSSESESESESVDGDGDVGVEVGSQTSITRDFAYEDGEGAYVSADSVAWADAYDADVETEVESVGSFGVGIEPFPPAPRCLSEEEEELEMVERGKGKGKGKKPAVGSWRDV